MQTSAKIQELEIIIEACKRYVSVMNNHEENITIAAITKCDGSVFTFKFCDENGETWEEDLWIDIKGVLRIENPITYQDIFDFADERGWTEEEINYIKGL